MIMATNSSALASTGSELGLTSDVFDSIDPNLNKDTGERTTPHGLLSYRPEMSIAVIQVLLDREGFSPGAINGLRSGHFDRVLQMYELRKELKTLTASMGVVEGLLAKSGGDAFVEYNITAQDVSGPFLGELPKRIQDQKGLVKLDYLRVEEALAERFHMDETFLRWLNPDTDFSKIGSKIRVANIGRYLDTWVTRIHADKALRQVTAYDSAGRILAVYPASIGSLQTPSPKGVFKVLNKAGFPAYTLAPGNGFEPIDDGRQVVIAPGPNNPVGTAWIGLSKDTYGIHGTPNPSSIGTAESHGCIRLTNWDAMELARLVRNGVEVVID